MVENNTNIEPLNNKPSILAIIGVIAFCLFVLLNYLGFWDESVSSFHFAMLERVENNLAGKPLPQWTPMLLWIYAVFGITLDAAVVSMVSALTYNFFPRLQVVFLYIIGILAFILSYDTLAELTDHRAIFLSIRFIIIMFGVYFGYTFLENNLFTSEKNNSDYQLGGIAKKIWLLILIAFNPILKFLTDMTIVQIHSSYTYWSKGFEFLATRLFSVVFLWGIAITLFFYGLNAIQDKNCQNRVIRIIVVFLVVPLTILIIPILRNRTWFF